MRFFYAPLPLALTWCLAAPAGIVAAQAPSGFAEAAEVERAATAKVPTFKRVRSEDRILTHALADGYARSEAFRELVDVIEHSNLLVYVFWNGQLPRLGGTLHVKGAANGQRTVFILISPDVRAYVIPMLAHELQHAVEVAGAPQIVDRESLLKYYARVGDPARLPRTYDTDAALDVEHRVSAEIRAARRGHDAAASSAVAAGSLSPAADSADDGHAEGVDVGSLGP